MHTFFSGSTHENQLQSTRWQCVLQGGHHQKHLPDDPQVPGQDLVGLPGQPCGRHLRIANNPSLPVQVVQRDPELGVDILVERVASPAGGAGALLHQRHPRLHQAGLHLWQPGAQLKTP